MRYSQLHVAEKYAKKGIRVFPCGEQKQPLTRNGFKDASSDINMIRKWWSDYPDAMIGSPNDQFTVVDIDDYNIPTECQWVVNGVLSSLQGMGVIKDDDLKVTTLSGGTHIYFTKDPSITRMIHVLPQIDILASGGYVILPDQTNYIAKQDQPWEYFQFLPKLDIVSIQSLAESIHDTTKHVNRVVKEYRKQNKASKPAKTGTHFTPKSASNNGHCTDMKKYNDVKEETPTKNIGAIDYENDRIIFDIKEGIYKPSDKDFTYFDGKEKLLDNSGKIQIEQQTLDTEFLMRLFHNREIQEKLCMHIGLPTPATSGKGKLVRSILPGHLDSKPSMGVRWNQGRTHIIVRDFSNHFNDKYEQNDYNLVRLYCVQKYQTNVPRLNAPEFTVWFLRMLVDAGILNIDKLKTPIIKSTDKLNSNQKKMLESMQLLDAIKKLHVKYDETFVCADKFSSAWSGLSVSTCNRHKKHLIDNGFVVEVGKFNCCPDREDGFFNTRLYKMPGSTMKKAITIKGKDMKLSEAVNFGTLGSPTPKKKESVVSVGQDKEEKDMQDRFPTLSTFAGFVVSSQSYAKIKHFTEDYNIENVPDNDNMFIPVYIDSEYRELDELDIGEEVTYFIDKFELEVVEGADDNQIMIAHGYSPPILDIIYEGKAKYSYDIDEPDVQFIVSSDVGDDFDESRLEFLEMMFNSYVGNVSTNRFEILHVSQGQVLQLMDGKDPILEDDE